ncbi:amidohydrolase family protein [Microbacterium algeriense]|uniref:Amidohydrolase family protein n=1 Tax=Microbacterium algeriense TaxID=2615184 RepID=A0ABQ6V9L6_9MICO|nr:amidohydrolase family protein [Microbacterium algeriense]KAB1867017.1 amidohydrolase family protein [Microbacterium algeriense]
MHAATFFDGTGWREGVVELADGRVRLRSGSPSALPRLDGVVLGGFTDHHVHLQLVDPAGLAGSRLGRVVDLGGNPDELRRTALPGVRIDVAGAFLTAPGGYPSDRDWAPEGSVREIADAASAADAVAEMVDAGASCIKVTSNSTAGPVFSDELLRTIVALAADHGLAVVAHAEGAGEAERVVRAGAAVLAHAPFTQRLDDEEIARQAAAASWISTLAIHADDQRAVAIDNVRRFHAAGGTVRYGTDMGNGPTPVDLNPAEITALREAGLDDGALLRALAPVDPLTPSAALLLVPGGSPATADPLSARPLTAADLKV